MAYEQIPTGNGTYMIDWKLVDLIVHDSAYFQSKQKNAKIRKSTGSYLLMDLPTTYHVEVDFHRAKADALASVKALRLGLLLKDWFDERTRQVCSRPTGKAVEGLREFLLDHEKKGRIAKQALLSTQRLMSSRSMKNIADAVSWGETWVSRLQWVRDMSAEVILAYATVVTGGKAKVLVALGGAALKGFGKYEDIAMESGDWSDTKAVGAGLVTANLGFITALIPTKGTGNDLAMVLVRKKMEFTEDLTVGLVEGKSLSEAAATAGMELALGKTLESFPLPASIKTKVGDSFVSDGVVSAVSDKLAGPLTTKIISAIDASANEKKVKATAKPYGRFTYTSPLLTHMAIVGPDICARR